ncbi:MAG: NMD3-related protein [Candidatus Micrarchaeota archaeon]
MKNVFCPRCGKIVETLVKGLCVDCFSSLPKPLVRLPKENVVLCVSCGEFFSGGQWIAFNKENFTLFLKKKLKSTYPVKDFKLSKQVQEKKLFLATVNVVLDVDGNEITKEFVLLLPLVKQLCRDCSLSKGGYHEAIVQLRGDKDKVSKMSEKMIKELSKTTFFSKTEEKKEGIDLFVGSKIAAMSFLSGLGLPYITSNKLVGVSKDGKRQLRLTICLRF